MPECNWLVRREGSEHAHDAAPTPLPPEPTPKQLDDFRTATDKIYNVCVPDHLAKKHCHMILHAMASALDQVIDFDATDNVLLAISRDHAGRGLAGICAALMQEKLTIKSASGYRYTDQWAIDLVYVEEAIEWQTLKRAISKHLFAPFVQTTTTTCMRHMSRLAFPVSDEGDLTNRGHNRADLVDSELSRNGHRLSNSPPPKFKSRGVSFAEPNYNGGDDVRSSIPNLGLLRVSIGSEDSSLPPQRNSNSNESSSPPPFRLCDLLLDQRERSTSVSSDDGSSQGSYYGAPCSRLDQLSRRSSRYCMTPWSPNAKQRTKSATGGGGRWKEWNQGGFERLQVRRVISKGDKSVVYEVEYAGSDGCELEIAALKVFNMSSHDCRELELWKRLDHPHIAKFLGTVMLNGWPGIVCELMVGGSLSDLIYGSSVIPISTTSKIATHIAMAIDYLHSLDVIHRDIKPLNILLNESLDAQLSDFGVTTYYSRGQGCLTGETGTYRYMAPEVIAHKEYGPECDVYSFAILLWETLHRQVPFAEMTPIQAAFAVALKDERPTIITVGEAEEKFESLIISAWATIPSSRPPAKRLVESLNQITESITHDFE